MENYFTSQKHNIFRNVAVLIYVFDADSRQLEKDLEYYTSCLASIRENSKNARIFCLIHKMDLIDRNKIYDGREKELKRRSFPLDVICFGTSIWDESLYKVGTFCVALDAIQKTFES